MKQKTEPKQPLNFGLKANLRTPLRVAAVLIAGALTADAQTWTTISDLPNAVCGEVGHNAVGHVFAVGRQNAPDGSSKAVVQASGDQGASWVALDQYFEAGLSYAHNRAFTVNPLNDNHLFAGGNLNNLLSNGSSQYDALWFIRERDPVTGVWSTADDYSKLANDIGQASCADIMVASNGDVYATGGGALGTGLGWVTRKRPAGSSTFATVDADYSGQTAGTGWDLGFHSSYGVFAAGEANGIWTVRRSLTGNPGTWSTVDSFYADRAWTSGRALCMLTTPSKLHVVGSAYKYRSGSHWIVRSSSDGGQSWTITDDYAPSLPSEARGLAQDASGNLWVCGTTVASAGGSQWVVRKGTIGTTLVKQGKTWVQAESITWTNIGSAYQLVPGKSAAPDGITIDAYGNVFVGGYATDVNGVNHWIVRKLPAQ